MQRIFLATYTQMFIRIELHLLSETKYLRYNGLHMTLFHEYYIDIQIILIQRKFFSFYSKI